MFEKKEKPLEIKNYFIIEDHAQNAFFDFSEKVERLLILITDESKHENIKEMLKEYRTECLNKLNGKRLSELEDTRLLR